MMTVRFPNGFSVQYNDANYVSRHAEYSDLLTKQGGGWVAQVPNAAIIEVVPACRTYSAIHERANERMIAVETELRSLKRKLSAALKQLEAK